MCLTAAGAGREDAELVRPGSPCRGGHPPPSGSASSSRSRNRPSYGRAVSVRDEIRGFLLSRRARTSGSAT
ncbi:hypothetical protein Axi01nite_36080 [Actinoplanes xinjiangensis]|nr:hypothetical protein Axi01nite_36080 [Actinoplanes xinjiangensis]